MHVVYRTPTVFFGRSKYHWAPCCVCLARVGGAIVMQMAPGLRGTVPFWEMMMMTMMMVVFITIITIITIISIIIIIIIIMHIASFFKNHSCDIIMVILY